MPKCSHIHCLIQLFILIVIVQPYPYFLIENTEPKCVTVTASHETTLTIQYDVPDLMTAESVEEKFRRVNEEVQKQRDPNRYKDGQADALYQRRMQEQLEASRRAQNMGVRDITITTQLQGIYMDHMGGYDYYTGMLHNEADVGPAPPVPHKVTVPNGTITFHTEKRNGMVEICVQSHTASVTTPARIGLNITQRSTWEHETETKRKAELALEKRRLLDEQHRLAKDHMYQISFDLKGLDYKLQFIVNHADYSQNEATKFHDKSLKLHRKVTIWPKVQLVILLVTSIWQAHHFIRFFKRHYI